MRAERWLRDNEHPERINALIGSLAIVCERNASYRTELTELKSQLAAARHERDIALGLLRAVPAPDPRWQRDRELLFGGRHEEVRLKRR